MNTTRLSAILDGILEAGWLSAIIVTPLFFNIYSSRVFEPDKLTTLRSIALVMAAVWLVRWVEERATGGGQLRFSWRTPLVLPTLFTVLVYLISTAFSVVPYTSFFGSYQRLQGTYTTLSYIVIFLIILDRMRTRAQLDRFITTLILNSLPIALYGFVQHARRDPLPWGGDVTQRVASNMGNPIFVAAYMIMAAFPTLSRAVDAFRSLLTDEKAGVSEVLRAAAYIFIFLVQVISIWYTHSRGPLMGLVMGLAFWAFLGLLALRRAALAPAKPAGAESVPLVRDLGTGIAFGLGTLGAAGAVGAVLYLPWQGTGGGVVRWLPAVAALVVLGGAWMTAIVNGRGWRWLWVSALVTTIVLAAGFLAVNLVDPLHAWAQQQPWLGRLDEVLQAETGTGKVRSLIWEGALQLILPHEPIQYPPTTTDPTGHPDPFNAIRPLVGYGPESMYVAYNRFYPPLLGHYESRTASPDRSHNETLDALVITGLLGFIAYLWIFGSLFYYGLSWLGLVPGPRWRNLLLGMMALGALVGVAVVIPTVGPHFFGLAIPVGMILGLLVYLVLYGFTAGSDPALARNVHPDQILLMGILATFVAHLIEINFGIAIASTRTTFWALAAAFVLVGTRQIVEREERPAPPQPVPTPVRKKKGRRQPLPTRPAPKARSGGIPSWLWTALGSALIGSLILGTLAYDFVNNMERLRDPWQIFWRSLTVLAISGPPRQSLGVLLIFGMAWAMTALLTVTQMNHRRVFGDRTDDLWLAALVVLTVSLLVGLTFGLVLAGRHAAVQRMTVQSVQDLLRLAEFISHQISLYYGFLGVVILLGGLALAGERLMSRRWGTSWGALALVVLVPLAILSALQTNLRPIRADIIYKQADPWDRAGQWGAAVPHYQRAAQLAPQEDFYYLYWGRALLEAATATTDTAQQEAILRETERVLLQAQAISPLNTDHSANLARMYQRWADLPAGQAQRETLLKLASRYYEMATSLSPNNAILWNQWATLHYYSMGDEAGFWERINRSLAIDDEFEQTWLIIGDVKVMKGDLDGAMEAYQRALDIQPKMPQVWNAVARIHIQKGQNAEAVEALHRSLELEPTGAWAWDAHRLLSIAYFQMGMIELARQEILRALEMAPQDQRPILEQTAQQMGFTVPVTAATP
ncbi:MAG: tetratricopeptide repeat protein [Anaerolineae bacterium]|nr:tetratricopeptide repeat protein [Anaerolineae bacterium]MCX8066499.1 tetratricopeptide repeat protein [Anaerolineae bacterium]MDW7991121.1 tetratricopeptide repeat protein [Anaerolineae bacterium]